MCDPRPLHLPKTSLHRRPPPPPSRFVRTTKLLQFARRHIGPSDADVEVMMKTVGVSSLDNLVDRTVPHSIRLDKVGSYATARRQDRDQRTDVSLAERVRTVVVGRRDACLV